MANKGMVYKGEREDDTFTVPSGGVYTYTFTDTYRKAGIILDEWKGKNKPEITHDNTSVTVTGANGDSGKITVIEK